MMVVDRPPHERTADTSQGSTRRYREEKRAHYLHLTVHFRASAQVVNVRVCGIRVLISPEHS